MISKSAINWRSGGALLLSAAVGALLYLDVRCIDAVLAALFFPEQYALLVRRVSDPPGIELLIYAGAIAPAVEEFVFRRAIVRFLARYLNWSLAVTVSALAFWVAHYEYFGTPYMFNMLLLAAVCQVLVASPQGLAAAIVCHVTFNLAILMPKISPLAVFEWLGISGMPANQLVIFGLLGAAATTLLWFSLQLLRGAQRSSPEVSTAAA